jgi:hypothetical protein
MPTLPVIRRTILGKVAAGSAERRVADRHAMRIRRVGVITTGINTVQTFLKSVTDGMALPLGLGNIAAYIAPPNPGDGMEPALYIWGAQGDERRMTVPRAQHGNLASGGNKQTTHTVDLWLVWFGPGDDPQADSQFPAIVDAVLALLRNLALLDDAQHAVDPVTGQLSQLLDVGEHLTWDYAPVRAVADQRYLRYDALITADITEIIQA